MRKAAAIIVSLTSLARAHRNDRPERARPQAAKMEIGELVSVTLKSGAQLVCHAFVGIHIEQDRAGVADQAVRPTGNDASADDAGERVHPEPAEGTGKQKAGDYENRYGGIGNNEGHGGPQVVVAGRRSKRGFRFLEDDGVILL